MSCIPYLFTSIMPILISFPVISFHFPGCSAQLLAKSKIFKNYALFASEYEP